MPLQLSRHVARTARIRWQLFECSEKFALRARLYNVQCPLVQGSTVLLPYTAGEGQFLRTDSRKGEEHSFNSGKVRPGLRATVRYRFILYTWILIHLGPLCVARAFGDVNCASFLTALLTACVIKLRPKCLLAAAMCNSPRKLYLPCHAGGRRRLHMCPRIHPSTRFFLIVIRVLHLKRPESSSRRYDSRAVNLRAQGNGSIPQGSRGRSSAFLCLRRHILT